MCVGYGKSIGGGIDARVEGHLRGGSEIAVHHFSAEIDDSDHLGGHGSEVGTRRCHCDQVSLPGGDVSRRAYDEPFLGKMTARARYSLSFNC